MQINGFVENGTYDDVKVVNRNDYNSTSDHAYNFNRDNQLNINENWSAELDAHYSRGTRRTINLECYSGTGYKVGSGAADNLGFSELGNGLRYADPSLIYSQCTVLTDPRGWALDRDRYGESAYVRLAATAQQVVLASGR